MNARAAAKTVRRTGRTKATASACDRLRSLIVSGRLTPGAPLAESELSKRLGVSRTPVRAALQRLQQEGLVTTARAGSMLRAIVAPLTAADMLEVFLMVGALEAAAARLLAACEPSRREAAAATLERLAHGFRDATSAGSADLARACELEAAFHGACSAGAGRRLLAELAVLQPQAARYQRAYASTIVQAPEDAALEHDAIVEAIRCGDQEAAERAVTRHWRASAERYGQAVTVLGERGNW